MEVMQGIWNVHIPGDLLEHMHLVLITRTAEWLYPAASKAIAQKVSVPYG